MGLARRRWHGGYLRLHLHAEGRLGAPSRPRALRDDAQLLQAADRERQRADGERAGGAACIEAEGTGARAAIAAPRRNSRHRRACPCHRRLYIAVMEKFTTLTGIAAPLPMINVDTDMIIP